MSEVKLNALELAGWLEGPFPGAFAPPAAAELRRLHALCDEMGEALEELHARITDHPAYADLDEQGEIDAGGDTAEFSYLARVARAALAKWKESK